MGVQETLGGGETFVALDKAWTLTPLCAGVRARYSEFCKLQALDDLRKLKDFLEPEEYRDDRSLLYARISAGEYTWGTPMNPEGMGEAVRVMLAGTEGKLRLLQLLLKEHHGDVDGKTVLAILGDGPDEVARALRAIMGLPSVEKERQPREEDADPFGLAALAGTKPNGYGDAAKG